MFPISNSVSVFQDASDASTSYDTLFIVLEYLTSSNKKNSASGPQKEVSPIPDATRCSSALIAVDLGQRSYVSPVSGSTTWQCTDNVFSA